MVTSAPKALARNRAPQKTTAAKPTPRPVAYYTGETYSVDESYGYLVRRLQASVLRHIERRVQMLDLTAQQWAPLLLLAQGKGDTAAALARALDTDTGSVTRMLDRLERKGLLKRRRSTNDRRVVHLELTSNGRHAIGLVPFVIAEVLNLHLAGFTDSEVRQMKRFLTRMIENGNQAAEPAAP